MVNYEKSGNQFQPLKLVNPPLMSTIAVDGEKANPSIPGRAPQRPDHMLSPDELLRRNRRRARNREAATRQRDRRLEKLKILQIKIDDMKEETVKLKEENTKLKSEAEYLRMQLSESEKAPKQMPPLQPLMQPQPYYMNQIHEGAVTPTVFLVRTPVYAHATNMASQPYFQFPTLGKERSSVGVVTDVIQAL